ncbi:hypothetical protein DCO58_07900 [Helicobacter saguini]|uniref:Uncharacterized protein n=2 Tax=Helicobacter saguini TaxID=1548018 RepID=A0A4U8SZP4_9HELI|nr:hypothetical protein [Helicobacter saguini]MWV61748.1 hypothetical protein [Helicobacter saguini]MWV67579.1 hypothetical protein [Helicobacter saguini]MWV69930.1 hypothetical protein [Helicobacter saguini]MWV72855.1 hypothetical protein [Helicobacter saguini]TLD92393.1 hypothetical protein LS64_010415 [Helicobacter saguini]
MKSNFSIDLELLSSLSISKSEAIVLDMLDYINKNPHFPAFKVSNVSLSELLQISQSHLYRILKKLIDKELVYKEFNITNFSIPKAFYPQIKEFLSDYIAKSSEIKLKPTTLKKLDSKTINELIEYISNFNYLILPKAKQDFINNLESMIENDSLSVNLRLCKANSELVIANPSELDSMKLQALKYVKEFFNLLLVRINVTKKGLIQQIKEVYKDKLLDFITTNVI